MPLIIMGFYCSGGALSARRLQVAGLKIGEEPTADRLPGPVGHRRDREVRRIHRRLLLYNGLTWCVDSPFIPVINQQRWRELSALVERR